MLKGKYAEIRGVPWLIFALSLLISVGLSIAAKNVSEQEAVNKLIFNSEQISLKIEEKLQSYALILRGAVALFGASENVSRRDFQTYTDTLAAAGTIPSIQGIGYAKIILPEELYQHQQEIQQEGFTGYRVHPNHTREHYTSIVYLEPFEGRNLRAFGYDMFSEPVRRAAMELARDTGNAALTGKVELLQEGEDGTQAGTLMYVPVYAKGQSSESVEQKRQAILGWVYSPYRMDDLMFGILQNWITNQEFNSEISIYDEEATNSESLLYDYSIDSDQVANFSQHHSINFNGKTWQLIFKQYIPSDFLASGAFWTTFAIGLTFSLLILGLLLSLSNTRSKAIALSKVLTKELHDKAQTVEEQQARLKFAVDEVGDGTWEWNIATGHLKLSKIIYQMLGYDEKELAPQANTLAEKFHPDDLDNNRKCLTDYFQGKTDIYSNEFRLKCRSGEYKWVLCRGTVIERDENGRSLRMVGIVTDISHRKQQEFEAAELKTQLAQASKMESIGQLTAGIAHDFNNLLGAISGYTLLVKESISPQANDTVINYLNDSLLASERAKELIKQMLTFSRQQAESDNHEYQCVSISDVLNEAVSLLRSSLPTTVDLSCHIAESCERMNVAVSAVNLHQIILNLGVNARDAVGEYGKVDIRLALDADPIMLTCDSCKHTFEGDFVRLSFKDNGTGISKSKLDRIFDPFYTSKSVGSGTGMGLSVVHGIVHSNGGHITVDTKLGQGTEFNLFIPIANETVDTAPTIEKNSVNKVCLDGCKVLVVDDETLLAEMMQSFLQTFSAEASVYTDSLKALEHYSQNPDYYDVIITDESMPNMSGMLLAENILKIHSDAKIILCTGFSHKASSESAKEIGIHAFFNKPVDMNSLLNKVHELCLEKHV